MVSYINRAIMALLVILFSFAGVATAQDFPTSSVAPTGQPWKTMRENGFTGGYAEACSILEISPEQCIQYQEMHSSGVCDIKQVPNGVVMDIMTYTDRTTGEHLPDNNVLVDLVDPPTRDTEVCDLGDGVVVMRFLGCNNHAIVNNWVPVVESRPAEVATQIDRAPIPQAPPVQITERRQKPNPVVAQAFSERRRFAVGTASCPNSRLNVMVYDDDALLYQGVAEEVALERLQDGDDKGLLFQSNTSGLFSALFHQEYRNGNLDLHSFPVYIVAVLIRDEERESEFFAGEVTGQISIPLPHDIREGDLINVRFTDSLEEYGDMWNVGMVSPGRSGIFSEFPFVNPETGVRSCSRYVSGIGARAGFDAEEPGSYSDYGRWLDGIMYPE